MSGRILICDQSPEAGAALVCEIRGCVTWRDDPEFCYLSPEDIFTKPLPDNLKAAFFTVNDMYEAEAMRKLYALHPDVLLILVSDSDSFSVWAWSVDALDYLMRPVDKDILVRALERCNLKPIVNTHDTSPSNGGN